MQQARSPPFAPLFLFISREFIHSTGNAGIQGRTSMMLDPNVPCTPALHNGLPLQFLSHDRQLAHSDTSGFWPRLNQAVSVPRRRRTYPNALKKRHGAFRQHSLARHAVVALALDQALRCGHASLSTITVLVGDRTPPVCPAHLSTR